MKSEEKTNLFRKAILMISRLIFLIVRFFVKLFYPKVEVCGIENLPDEGAIIVGNHTKMNGPIIAQLYLPRNNKIWCTGEMVHLKEVPAYAYKDFWSGKPKRIRWFYHILSYLIAPLSVILFTNADIIPVYHDMRLATTFRKTVECLKQGDNIVIFPEHYKEHNHIIMDFQSSYIDVARYYYRKTGKNLNFVPLYNAPMLHKSYFGKPIAYDDEKSKEENKKIITEYLMDEITNIACSLPKHKVVTYGNVSKKKYPYNIPE